MSYYKTLKFWKKSSLNELLPPPVKAQHGEYSMIFSACDKPSVMTSELLQVSLRGIEHAAKIDFKAICHRSEQGRTYANLWPGEHYRLLAGLLLALKPTLVLEIGTSTGLSALCMKEYLPPDGKIVTFDVVPWNQYSATLFKEEDFDEQLVQYVDDLGDESTMQKYSSLIKGAGLIFIDATHDGDLEERILFNLMKIRFEKKVFVLLDDIKVWTMLKMWRNISLPKIDLTSFGHWSGTGLIALN